MSCSPPAGGQDGQRYGRIRLQPVPAACRATWYTASRYGGQPVGRAGGFRRGREFGRRRGGGNWLAGAVRVAEPFDAQVDFGVEEQVHHRAPCLGLLDHGGQLVDGLGRGYDGAYPHHLEMRAHRPVALPPADVDGEGSLEVQRAVSKPQFGGGAAECHRLAAAQRSQHSLQRRRSLASTAVRRRLVKDKTARLCMPAPLRGSGGPAGPRTRSRRGGGRRPGNSPPRR